MEHSTRDNITKGTLFVVAAAFLWSTNGILIKLLALSPMLICGTRSLIAGVAMLPFLRIKKIPLNGLLLLMAVSFCMHCTFLVLAFRNTSAPIASGGQFAAPLWLFFAARMKKQPWKKKETIPLLFLFTGLMLFMFSSSEGSSLKGNIYAVLSSFSYAALTYSSSRVSGKNPLGITSLTNLFTAAVAFLFLITDAGELFALPPLQWGILLFLGIQLGLGYASYYNGMRYISPQRASIVSTLELIAAPLWIVIFLRETPDILSYIGFAFIVMGVALNILLVQGGADIENYGTQHGQRRR